MSHSHCGVIASSGGENWIENMETILHNVLYVCVYIDIKPVYKHTLYKYTICCIKISSKANC